MLLGTKNQPRKEAWWAILHQAAPLLLRDRPACVLDQAGQSAVHRKIPSEPAPLLRLLKPYRRDVAVAVECMFCWYRVADLCAEEGLPFLLGHAPYMKAIRGGKRKNDRIDSYKIAALMRGGKLPQAYVNPRGMRATRDLLRRRLRFVRKRGGLFSHIQNTITQHNLPSYEERIDQARNRAGLLEHFEDEDVQMFERAQTRRGSDAPRYAWPTLERALQRTGPAAPRRARRREIPGPTKEVRAPRV